MIEKVVTLLKRYKGNEYNVLRVTVVCENNCHQHLAIKINSDGVIKIVKCPYVEASVV